MDLSQETLEKLTALARLDLTEEERETMYLEFAHILAYMGRLSVFDGPEPMTWEGPVNVLRPDVTAPSLVRAVLLQNAAETDGDTFIVPRTVEEVE